MSSLRVEKILRQLGQDIQVARKKRRIPVKDFAARIGVAEGTVIRLEKGEPGTRLETLAMALLALGELPRCCFSPRTEPFKRIIFTEN